MFMGQTAQFFKNVQRKAHLDRLFLTFRFHTPSISLIQVYVKRAMVALIWLWLAIVLIGVYDTFVAFFHLNNRETTYLP